MPEDVLLTARFQDALVFATARHAGQVRKGTDIPYTAHLLGTCSLVLEAGGDEDQAIAGLLHDLIEDSKGTIDEVRDRFGDRVARIVDDCSDSDGSEPRLPWPRRKERYLAELAGHGEDSLLVSNADKLHNLRAIVADYRRLGEELWARFNPDSDPLWYYSELCRLFSMRAAPLAEELEVALEKLRLLRTGG